MKASQMIYTACGKDKSGAFSVWSKSADVTKAECDEIVKLMSYRKPNNVPYEPTEEELRTLFPKKYCYYNLSSGRKCIALTTYVGKVYSDMDARNGNFIIHAFIFNDLEGFNPFGLMKLDSFKTCLSYEEWHDNPAPDVLPVVELEANPSIDESSIRNMMSGNSKQNYISLLQAVIDAAYSNETVTFNDTEENQIKIYSLIGTLLPSCLFATTTFSNQYSTQLDFTMSSSGMKPIKLRNIFSGMINTSFNYQEQLDAGQAVFHFEKGICSQIKPKRYLEDIILSLESGNSLFAILKKVDKVNTIMNEAGCDIDTAITVYYLIQQNLNWFSGADEYLKAFSIALEHHYVDEHAIAAILYKDIILTGKWGQGSEIIALVKYAYTFNDQPVKAAIMDKYFSELQLYGVNVSGTPSSVLTQVKENAPFPWEDFAVAVVRNPKWGKYVDATMDASKLYFVFDAAVLAVLKNLSDADNKVGYDLLFRIVRKSVARRAFDEVKLYFDSTRKLGDKAQNWLVEVSLSEYLNNGVKDEATLDFVLRVICSLESEPEKIKLLGQLIICNMKATFFMQTYIKYAEQYQGLFMRIENTYKTDNVFSDFLFRKDAYVFRNSTKVTYNSLSEYFHKYYQAGYDSGVYLEKLKQYISLQTGKSKVAECMRIYDQVKVLDDAFADVIDVLVYIDNEIFSLSMDDLLNYTPMYMSGIIELNKRLMTAHRNAPDKYAILSAILLLRGKFGENACQDCIQRNTVYGYLNQTQIGTFVEKHFNEALDLYCRYKKKKVFNTNTLLISIFDKPLASSRNAEEGIVHALEDLGGNEYYELMADIMAYAFNVNDRFASALMVFIQRYIEVMKKGDYKKLFKKVLEIMPKDAVPAVKKYTDKYLEEHMSFFEKLFSKKK